MSRDRQVCYKYPFTSQRRLVDPFQNHHPTMYPFIYLKSFAFGKMCRDRTFSAEEDTFGNWDVGCDVHERELVLRKQESFESTLGFLSWEGERHVRVRYPAHHITALAASPESDSRYLAFLEAHSPPLFETTSWSTLGNGSARLSSINEGKEMRPVVRCICLTFRTREDQQTFLKRCKEFHLPRPTEIDIPVERRNLYSVENLLKLERLFRKLCFGLAFEAEKSIFSGVLDPLELSTSLKEHMLRLQRKNPNTMPSPFFASSPAASAYPPFLGSVPNGDT